MAKPAKKVRLNTEPLTMLPAHFVYCIISGKVFFQFQRPDYIEDGTLFEKVLNSLGLVDV